MAASSGKPKPSREPAKSNRPSTSKANMRKSHLSQEMVVDSDDEDAPLEDRSIKIVAKPTIVKPTKKQVDSAPTTTNGTKRKSPQSSSSSDSEDESVSSESDGKEYSAGRQAKKVKVHNSKESSSEEEDKEDEDMPDVNLGPIEGHATGIRNTSGSGLIRRFKPPAGFTALDSQAVKSSLLASIDLSGKQIWHICAPANVPLDSVTEIASDAIRSNTSALSYRGIDFAWSEDADSETYTVLLPSRDGYTPMQNKIAKRLHLRQKIDLAQLSTKQASQVTGSSAAAHVAQASVSTIRPQPKGLRMRYKPPGFGNGEPGVIGFDSDSEGQDDERSMLQFPVALGGASEKQTVPAGDGVERKMKKKKKEGDTQLNGELVNGNAEIRHEEGSSTSVVKTPIMKVVAPEAKDPVVGEETELERHKRRKEAKRLKKEAKEAKLASS